MTNIELFQIENTPRKLNRDEIRLLEGIFPENVDFYSAYFSFIKNWYICRYENGDPVKVWLCPDKTTIPDFFVNPVINLAGKTHEDNFYEFTFFEKSDDTLAIEFDVKVADNYNDYSLACWKPGDLSPFGGELITTELPGSRLVLVRDKAVKRVWIFDAGKNINFILPVTSFYNNLMIVKEVKDPETAFNYDNLFTNEFTENQLTAAVYLQCKSIPVLADNFVKDTPEENEEKPGFFKKLFK